MLELLGPADEGVEDDPLAAAVGIGTSTAAPDDPALARLSPTATPTTRRHRPTSGATPSPACATQKRAALQTAVGMLGHPGVRTPVLDGAGRAVAARPQRHPAGAGQRLEVGEDWDELLASLADDDPRLPLFWVYDRLTYLEESLVQALW